MRKLVTLTAVALAACAPATRTPAALPPPVVPLTARVAGLLPDVVLLEGASPEVVAFYGARAFTPAWSDSAGVTSQARDVLAIAADAASHGLDPAHYPVDRARYLLDAGNDPRALAELDVALTQAWLAYGGDLAQGVVDPRAVSEDWSAAPGAPDLGATLNGALSEGRAAAALTALAPRTPGYERLRVALAERRQAGDEAGARRVAANLERWRWLPRDLGDRYVMVNTPAFELALVEGGAVTLTSRVIVGQCDRPTPIVSGGITHVVLSPAWRVPPSIAAEEILPAVRADPQYLERAGFVVYGPDGALVERPDTIDWRGVSDTALPYRFMQAPGPANPLGRVKFFFANEFDVYLHDTPHSALFETCPRPFSHGCVRVEQALELAALLLRDARWPRDSIVAAAGLGRERWLTVRQPVNVHLVYWTAWVDENGALQLRDDVYGWDALLLRALERRECAGEACILGDGGR